MEKIFKVVENDLGIVMILVFIFNVKNILD